MPSATALEKHRARLESKKQSLLAQVEQCNNRLETLRTARKAQQILWDSNAESETEVETCPVSQERLEEIERLKIQLQATQELCRVDELTVEVKVIERPENIVTSSAEEREAGAWSEVIARGRVEYVPFRMKFFIYENVHKAVTYHCLSTIATKPLHCAELAGSALHACRAPSEALHCLVQYSRAYKERRDTLLAIANRYRDVQIWFDTTECGGCRLTCSEALEVEWRAMDGETFLHPFRHRFLMSCDDDGNLVEKYLPTLQSAYKKLKDPKNGAEERMKWLCKIIDVCLQMYANNVVQSTELDAETVAQIANVRVNLDVKGKVTQLFPSAEKMEPVKRTVQHNNENRRRQDETTLKRKTDEMLHEGKNDDREKQAKQTINGRINDLIRDNVENGIRQKTDKTHSNRKIDELLQDGKIDDREKQAKKTVNGRTNDLIQGNVEIGITRNPDKTISNRKIDEMLQGGKNGDKQKQVTKTVNGRTNDMIQENVENGITQKTDKTISNRKIDERLQSFKNGDRQKQVEKTVNGRTNDTIRDECENEERQEYAKETANGKFNDVRKKRIREDNVKEGEKLTTKKLIKSNLQKIPEKDGGNKGKSQNNTKPAKDVNEKERENLQEKRSEPVAKNIKNYIKKNTESKENTTKSIKNILNNQETGNQDPKNNSDKENQQTEGHSDQHIDKNKEQKNSDHAIKNAKNKPKNKGLKVLNFVQKYKIKDKQKVNIINKDSDRHTEPSSENTGHHKNNKTEEANKEFLNPFNIDITLSPIVKVGILNTIPKNAQTKNCQPISTQKGWENQQKPVEPDLHLKNNKINPKRPETTNNDVPEKRLKSSQKQSDTDKRTKVANNDSEKRVNTAQNAVSMVNLARKRVTMGDRQSATVSVNSAQKSDTRLDSTRNAESRIVSSKIAAKIATSASNERHEELDMAQKVEKKVGSAQNGDRRVTIAQNAKEKIYSGQNAVKRAVSAQNAERRINLALNEKERATSVHNSGKASPLKRAKSLTTVVASNGAPKMNKPKNALNVLRKRKISPEELGTKIPRMMPSFRAHLSRPATPRRSPRKLIAANKDKGFFLQ